MITYGVTDNDLEDPDCPICQIEFDEGEKSRPTVTLVCEHMFHQHCMSEWVEQCKTVETTASCPMCRAVLSEHEINQIQETASSFTFSEFLSSIALACCCPPICPSRVCFHYPRNSSDDPATSRRNFLD